MDDTQILALYFDRSEQAIGETHARYGAYLSAVASRLLGSAPDAEECVNDTYLHAWNAIPPQRPESLRHWLARVTRNLSLDRWRRLTAQKRGGGELALLLDELEGCLPAPAGVEDSVQEREAARLISVFLRAQRQQARVIFVLRYWHGESILAIAQRIGANRSMVKSSLSRTRTALKRFLEKEGVRI